MAFALFLVPVCVPAVLAQTAAPVPPPATDAPAPTTPAGKEPLPLSLFFTMEEQARIRAAIAEHENLKNVKVNAAESKANDYLNQLTDDPKPVMPVEETVYAYPQFFLESLVYHTPDDWVVMINRQRISATVQPENSEINVLSVDNEKVLFEWKPKHMERVSQTWVRERNDDVLVDSKFGKVIFTLHPNQTFSSYVMRVVEGKVRPVVIDLRTGAAPVPAPAVPPPGAAEATADDPDRPSALNRATENITTEDIKNNVGLKGLNKTYKRMGLE